MVKDNEGTCDKLIDVENGVKVSKFPVSISRKVIPSYKSKQCIIEGGFIAINNYKMLPCD